MLDLGSGGGIDVLLSARRVGPTGKAYGLDMTDEMLALAEENKRKSGLTNVEFLKGEIESIPLPDNSVDVIISNCVINLSGDKDRVLQEAFRVLKPGGRFAVSDVVVRGTVPEAVRKSMELWVGCVAGALGDDEYVAKLARAGFHGIEIEPTRVYGIEDARGFLSRPGSTSMRWRRRSTAASSARSFAPANPRRRAANPAVARSSRVADDNEAARSDSVHRQFCAESDGGGTAPAPGAGAVRSGERGYAAEPCAAGSDSRHAGSGHRHHVAQVETRGRVSWPALRCRDHGLRPCERDMPDFSGRPDTRSLESSRPCRGPRRRRTAARRVPARA